jgi:enoyl-CoA hydratase/carnithine racemase
VELTAAPKVVRLPERLDVAATARLAQHLDDAIASPCRSIRVEGATADVFCLGLALDDAAGGVADVQRFAEILLALHRSPKPLLAVVDGCAIGGGLGLAAACDWVLATDRASFALPELLWGLVPAMIWPVLSLRMAPHTARRWAIAARSRPAAEAEAAGLVDELIPPASLEPATRRAEAMLARLEPTALVAFREWAWRSRTESFADSLASGADVFGELVKRPVVRDRWTAFAAGEAPWTQP